MSASLLVATGAAALVLGAPPAFAEPCDFRPSLAHVLERVEASPRIAAATSDTEAQRELARQAGARPNPDLRLELEDFTGSGSFADFGQSQTTLSFAQKIELGGVRDRRVDAAEREGDAVAARGAAALAQAQAAAKLRFVELAAGADELDAARAAESLARDLAGEVGRRAASAAASESDVARARVAASKAALEAETKRRDLAVAAERLAASWGGTSHEADCYADAAVAGRLHLAPSSRTNVPPGVGARPPAVAIAEAEVEAVRAEVALARANAAPDLEVGAGLRHLAGPDDVSAVAELRVELPIFDRNEGAVAAAERRLAAAQSRALATRSEIEARAGRLREQMAAAATREHAIATQMIPAAEAAAASLLRAWQSGAASTYETIDARRAVVELRQQRIEATTEFWRAATSLEALVGRVSPDLPATAVRPAAARTEH